MHLQKQDKVQFVAIFPQKGSGMGFDSVRLQRKSFCLQQHSDDGFPSVSCSGYLHLEFLQRKRQTGAYLAGTASIEVFKIPGIKCHTFSWLLPSCKLILETLIPWWLKTFVIQLDFLKPDQNTGFQNSLPSLITWHPLQVWTANRPGEPAALAYFYRFTPISLKHSNNQVFFLQSEV